MLRDVEGLSNHEISEALGITVANVKTRVHRARLFLRKRLAPHVSDAPFAACLHECPARNGGLPRLRFHASYSKSGRMVRDMLKQLAMALLLALVASTGASVAWADVESDGTSINSIQAP